MKGRAGNRKKHVPGRMVVWVDVCKSCLRITYSNQKLKPFLSLRLMEMTCTFKEQFKLVPTFETSATDQTNNKNPKFSQDKLANNVFFLP